MTHGAAAAYRDHREGLERRLADALGRIRRELEGRPLSRATRVEVRRCARLAAGIVGVTGGGLVLVHGAVGTLVDFNSSSELRGSSSALMVAVVAAAIVTYGLARVLAAARLARRLRRSTCSNGDLDLDVVRAEAAAPLMEMRQRTQRLETWSIAAPLMALSLLAPLTIHYVVYTVVSLCYGELPRFDAFDWWFGFSALLVGHAHLVLAGLTARFATKLSRTNDVDTLRKAAWACWGWTIAVSAVPGVVLFALPPIATAATGACFIFGAFAWARRTVKLERAQLT